MVLIRVSCGKTVDSACKSLKYVLSFLTLTDEAQQYDKYWTISVNDHFISVCDGKTEDSAHGKSNLNSSVIVISYFR